MLTDPVYVSDVPTPVKLLTVKPPATTQDAVTVPIERLVDVSVHAESVPEDVPGAAMIRPVDASAALAEPAVMVRLPGVR